MTKATKNKTPSKQILERFQHVNADGETLYVIDAAPAYRKLNVSDEANIGEAALRLNPFTDLKPEDFSQTAGLINKILIVTGEPGSGKTQHHRREIKMMMKNFGSSAYVVDAHGAVLPNASYSNLIEEYSGRVFKASEALSHPDFLQENSVLGIDATNTNCDFFCRIPKPEFILNLAKHLHQAGTKDQRHIFLVIEEAESFDLFRSKEYFNTLMELVSVHFSIALNTRAIAPVLGLGIERDSFDLVSLGKRKRY